jgi:uncharacterized membrane protein
MAAGYWFGEVMAWEPARRRTFCLRLGWAAIVLFLLLRGLDGYGDPNHWKVAQEWNKNTPIALRFLATNKYPASLVFLAMTLGPMFVAIPYLEHARSRFAGWMATIGRVPLFFYLLHIPLIHLLAREERYGLGVVYGVWILVVVLLYWPCLKWMQQKQRNKSAWLSYL